jgi:hypothetical protein
MIFRRMNSYATYRIAGIPRVLLFMAPVAPDLQFLSGDRRHDRHAGIARRSANGQHP